MSDELKPCPNKGSPCFCTGICKEPIGYEKENAGYYTKYLNTRTDERAEMQAAIVELRKGLTRLRKTIEVNADDVFWMHDMGACHESAHDCIDNLLEDTKKWGA